MVLVIASLTGLSQSTWGAILHVQNIMCLKLLQFLILDKVNISMPHFIF